MTIEFVYKIESATAWREACASPGYYLGSKDDKRDGYIHLSTALQVPSTLEKYFRARKGLVIVCFASNALAPNLKWEPARDGALFPHYYGNLATKRALWDAELTLTPSGHHQLPDELK